MATDKFRQHDELLHMKNLIPARLEMRWAILRPVSRSPQLARVVKFWALQLARLMPCPYLPRLFSAVLHAPRSASTCGVLPKITASPF